MKKIFFFLFFIYSYSFAVSQITASYYSYKMSQCYASYSYGDSSNYEGFGISGDTDVWVLYNGHNRTYCVNESYYNRYKPSNTVDIKRSSKDLCNGVDIRSYNDVIMSCDPDVGLFEPVENAIYYDSSTDELICQDGYSSSILTSLSISTNPSTGQSESFYYNSYSCNLDSIDVPDSGGSTGGDTSGGSTGGDTSGGSTGGDTSGGSTGGDTSGGSTGGDTSGGSTGGDTSGGSTGGDTSGGSTTGSSNSDLDSILNNISNNTDSLNTLLNNNGDLINDNLNSINNNLGNILNESNKKLDSINSNLQDEEGKSYLSNISKFYDDLKTPLDEDTKNSISNNINNSMNETLDFSFSKYSNILGFGSSYGSAPDNINVNLFGKTFILLDFTLLNPHIDLIRSLFISLAYLYGFMNLLRSK